MHSLWFMLIYIVGVYIRKMNLLENIKVSVLKKAVVISAIAVFMWHEILPKTAYNYSNPLVIFEASVIFMLFARMQYKQRFINFIAPASFTCFLIHGYLLSFIGKYVLIENSFGYVMILLVMCVIGIYIFSALVMIIWNSIYKYTLLKNTSKLPVIIIMDKR